MGEASSISWTDDTFNPWIGCTKISPECAACYASVATPTRVARAGGLELWGDAGARRITSADNWRKPFRWNREAERTRRRRRVFCASLSDVFEARADLEETRARLWKVIEETPHLDWMLLTKRAENIDLMLPRAWLAKPRPNVWLGTTVGTEKRLEQLHHLLEVPAVVHFVSAEPLLEPLDIQPYLPGAPSDFPHRLAWVIAGGESYQPSFGSGLDRPARPMHPDWVRSLRDQCAEHKVAFHFKQWGDWLPQGEALYLGVHREAHETRRMPTPVSRDGGVVLERVGVAASGRNLDGRQHNGFPEVHRAA